MFEVVFIFTVKLFDFELPFDALSAVGSWMRGNKMKC